LRVSLPQFEEPLFYLRRRDRQRCRLSPKGTGISSPKRRR
jgi:hypothetical protein